MYILFDLSHVFSPLNEVHYLLALLHFGKIFNLFVAFLFTWTGFVHKVGESQVNRVCWTKKNRPEEVKLCRGDICSEGM